MSHFTVLVIGEDPEKQLEPYAEQWDTNTPPYFAEFESMSDEYRKEYDELSAEELNKYPTFKQYCEEYHGSIMHMGEWGYWHNPNAKWDWYQLGGRWTGFFKIKPENQSAAAVGSPGIMTEAAPEGRADQLYKEDLDIQGMRMQIGRAHV